MAIKVFLLPGKIGNQHPLTTRRWQCNEQPVAFRQLAGGPDDLAPVTEDHQPAGDGTVLDTTRKWALTHEMGDVIIGVKVE